MHIWREGNRSADKLVSAANLGELKEGIKIGPGMDLIQSDMLSMLEEDFMELVYIRKS